MAQRIKEIHVNNFKFFGNNSEPINVDGKNILIYGENGSGKSSIFWALYTLLECSNKEDDDIKKYFQKRHKDSLVNIYANPGVNEDCNSFVSVELDDGTLFKISLMETSINTNLDAKKSNYATDFINYKFLFKTYDFKHSDEIDLFSMFENYILPYVKFTPVRYWKKRKDSTFIEYETENANEIWNIIKNGPRNDLVNLKGNHRYPYRREPQFKEFHQIVTKFESELSNLVTAINTNGNPILKSNFSPKMAFKLNFKIVPYLQKTSFYLTAQKFRPPIYKILLTIPDYDGHQNVISKPHSFLNEAKLTGIGLSIRLAVLQRRAEDAKIRALILDDLLISLDMLHREKMIELIIQNYSNNYQIFHFTHDINLFEFMKDKIRNAGNISSWKFYEIYEDDQAGISFPFISESRTDLEKAKNHLRRTPPDLPACANYMRKTVERFCQKFIPLNDQYDRNFNKKDLNALIQAAVKEARTKCLSIDPFLQLDHYRQTLFNPGSHYNLANPPLFKNELKNAIHTIEIISNLTSITI